MLPDLIPLANFGQIKASGFRGFKDHKPWWGPYWQGQRSSGVASVAQQAAQPIHCLITTNLLQSEMLQSVAVPR